MSISHPRTVVTQYHSMFSLQNFFLDSGVTVRKFANVLVLARAGLIFAPARRGMAKIQKLLCAISRHSPGTGEELPSKSSCMAWWKEWLGIAGDFPCEFLASSLYLLSLALLLLLFAVFFHCCFK